MIEYDDILKIDPYCLNKQEKEKLFSPYLKLLTAHHYKQCESYRRILDRIGNDMGTIETCPFIPVRLFKQYDLKSIDTQDVFKCLTSSGTSGQSVSKIYLDKHTALYQQKTLVKIVSNFTHVTRMPMLIIDSPSVIKDRNMFSARGAGILGFSIFGADKTYALDDDMQLDIKKVTAFLEKHKGEKILLFGFTFMVWQYFYKALKAANIQWDLSNGILIHGGGWKKLLHEAVSSKVFKNSLKDITALRHVHDYYGMVEQTGCIYLECEYGHLHTSHFSDIIMRRPYDFSVCDIGEKGIIQTLSLLPKSYPGHSLLTEDEGVLLGEDDCPCGRNGKYFKVIGRIKNAEIRGCSDTHSIS